MRINKFVAQASGLSRRAADQAIQAGRVSLDGQPAKLGQDVSQGAKVTLDGRLLTLGQQITLMLNKPPGYVCSRQGQGSRTIYELLPPEYQSLKAVGRLDKESSGLILLTNNGQLAHELTHPRFVKAKIYEVALDKPLDPADRQKLTQAGVQLEDGPSRLALAHLTPDGLGWRVTISEGRNRQIRRTFAALGYTVTKLHRTDFGPYALNDLGKGQFRQL